LTMDDGLVADGLKRAAEALEAGEVERALAVYVGAAAPTPSRHPEGPRPNFRGGEYDEGFVASIGVAVCYARMRRWGEAVEALIRMVETYPESGMVRAYLGAARFELGEIETARDDLDAAVTMTPDDAIVWVKRGEAMLRLGLLKDALSDLGRAARSPMPDLATREYVRALLTQTRRDLSGSVERVIPSPAHLWRRLTGRRAESARTRQAMPPLAWRER
jgi:tetratricopeptide (TPR) repeat protein